MKKIKLGDVLSIKHGFAFKSENYVEKSNYALITLANISETNSFQLNRDKLTYYGADFPSGFILNEGDLIMPLTEQAVGLLGNSAFIPKIQGITFVLNQRVGKVVIKDNLIDKYYLHYLLATNTVKQQLEYRASGTSQRNISPDDVYDVTVFIPDINEQHKIGKLLYSLEKRIETNKVINNNLEQQLRTIYDYWFTQFDFPDENCKPYRSSGGKMVWNDELKREVPEGWSVASIISNPLSTVIKPGVTRFDKKTYFATADVDGRNILDGTIISFEGRESRANMQPTINSVWFAKMKNSVKHLILNAEMKDLIDSSILSTGFFGLQVQDNAFEYIASFLDSAYFETRKDALAHGATQQAVNNDDLESLYLAIPDVKTLQAFHDATQKIYAKISINIVENRKLVKLRDWLLPMLMNGQATVAD